MATVINWQSLGIDLAICLAGLIIYLLMTRGSE